jgi:tetratricopeptide (TPR) repeat protein
VRGTDQRSVRGRVARGLMATGLLLLAACATRVAPPLPSTLAYPAFVYPVVPAGVGTPAAAAGVDEGWRYLQSGDLAAAGRAFAAVSGGGFYPALTGDGWVAVARGDYAGAAVAFGAALDAAPAYVPALVGQGQAELAQGRDAEALAAFERAVAADPSLVDLRRRADLLRVRVLQGVIDTARRARDAGDLAAARTAYLAALDASPATAFLYRELGAVEQARGDLDAALGRYREALALDAGDVDAAVGEGEALAGQGDHAGAIAAFTRAAGLGPAPDLAARIDAGLLRSRDALLPPEFQAMGGAAAVTRGDLAAVIGVRLGAVLDTASPVQVVVTDIRDHWAQAWVAQVIRAGVIEEFPNHTFQPQAPLRRVELAAAVRRVVELLAPSRPTLGAALAARPDIADVAATHLGYPAVAAAVASGVLDLREGRFGVNSPVSGAEAIEVVARLQALAAGG